MYIHPNLMSMMLGEVILMRKVIKMKTSNQKNDAVDQWFGYLIHRLLMDELDFPILLQAKITLAVQKKIMKKREDYTDE